ncbi:hypothetical protein [Frankia sp. Cr2]|uniref:hypothetical protein n=1 Tax=Frankia sp. Cr2 TaxID=3073932 RepID=UPI002AD346CD|nr:hypothetical protein [Frankia sp. Cr2]
MPDTVHASTGEPLPSGQTGAAAPSYTACVTAAFDYEDMHHLVDRLTPAQVRRLRLLVTQDEELGQVVEALTESVPSVEPEAEEEVPAGLLALIGAVETGRTDVAERHDDYFRERIQRRHPPSS